MPVHDLRGRRYGRLIAREEIRHPTDDSHSYWTCACDCGQTVTVRSTRLTTGLQVSCGCWRADPAVRQAARLKTPPGDRVAIARQGAAARAALVRIIRPGTPK